MIKLNGIEVITVGDILKFEFLNELGITPYRLAKETKLSHTLIGKIIAGTRSVSVDTALRFAQFFGTTPEYWINLQLSQDLKLARMKQKEEKLEIKPYNFNSSKYSKTADL